MGISKPVEAWPEPSLEIPAVHSATGASAMSEGPHTAAVDAHRSALVKHVAVLSFGGRPRRSPSALSGSPRRLANSIFIAAAIILMSEDCGVMASYHSTASSGPSVSCSYGQQESANYPWSAGKVGQEIGRAEHASGTSCPIKGFRVMRLRELLDSV
jgi:hypothetical protein